METQALLAAGRIACGIQKPILGKALRAVLEITAETR
jgi:hypothetical protein